MVEVTPKEHSRLRRHAEKVRKAADFLNDYHREKAEEALRT